MNRRNNQRNLISQKIVLIDDAKFASLMIEYNIGVSTKYTLEIKKINRKLKSMHN